MTAQAKDSNNQDQHQPTHQFGADVARLLSIVSGALYTNHDVFLRELISNSADACDRLRYEAIQNPELTKDNAQMRIHVYKDTNKRTLIHKACTSTGTSISGYIHLLTQAHGCICA